jgi:glycosyltransferase involved in cell wall biosynthesis
VLTGADGIVVISNALRERVISRRPAIGSRVWVEHDGADVDSINAVPHDRAAAREQLRLSPTKLIAVYTGRVNEEKGADVVLAAAERLGERGVAIVLVGRVYGEALARRAAALENVTLTGFVPPAQVPLFLRAADILLLPGTSRLPYADYTSPVKMFEYMAAGRPIVASDLPVLGEVLVDGQNALTYPASSPDALAGAIRRLQSDPSLAASLADRAMTDVEGFAWERRAERILSRLDAAGG